MTRTRRAEATTGLGAIAALLALVVGLPVLLYLLGGSPLPGHLSSLTSIGHGLLHRDSASVVLAAVREVSWIAWAAFTLAVLTEIQAALRHRTPPRLLPGGLQDAAGRLVALAALTFTAAPVGTLLATPQPVSATAVVPAADVTPLGQLAPPYGEHARPGPQGMSMGFFQLVTVRPGDCLWTIARQYLGNGDRFHEIVALNLGHDMGHGQVFTDPSVIWPGWVLHLPARAAGHHDPAGPRGHEPGGHLEGATHGGHLAGATHGGHPTSHRPFSHPHRTASASSNGHAPPVALTTPAPVTATPRTGGQAGQARPAQASSDSTPLHSGQESTLPVLVAFGTGVLAGGAAMSLSRLRHRQRQTRRRGRRIPLPVSAPVALAEQRLNIAAAQEPVTSSLRGVLRDLGSALVATGAQLPQITALRLEPDVLEVLLASPAAEPPPPPFTVPGGYQGMTWRLRLDDELPGDRDEAGDLLPGLLTVGTADGGYLLIDLEHLQVTQVDGPASLTAPVLRGAAAELATGQLAGWYELILVGFPELAALGGRGTCCDTLDAGLDLLAAKAVALRRRLGDAPAADVRYHRLTEPGDEDWALTLLVSAVPPTSGQLAMLSDLAADPGGIAALVAAGTATPPGRREPASIDLSAGPDGSGPPAASIWPLQLQVRPQPLDDTDYQALTTLFATAAEDYDIAPADPPYDTWIWPQDLADRDEPSAWAPSEDDPEPEDGEPEDEEPEDEEPVQLEPNWAPVPEWPGDPAWSPDPAWADGPAWTDGPETAADRVWADGPETATDPVGPGGQFHPAQDHPAQDHPDHPAQDHPAQDDPAQDHLAQDHLAQDDPAQDDPAWDQPAWHHPAREQDQAPADDQEWAGELDRAGEYERAGELDWAGEYDRAGEYERAGDREGAVPQPEAAPLQEDVVAPEVRPDQAVRPQAVRPQAVRPHEQGADALEAPAADPPAEVQAETRPPSLRIGVLGAFTINGQPGALLPAQSQLVLALAMHAPSGLSNQQLCYLLGADPDRPKPSDSLRQLIVRTRRQLGRAPDRREWIEHMGGGQYALHPGARFDWQEFSQLTTEGMRSRDAPKLRHALGLIRGRPFTGCYYWWLDLGTTESVRAQIVDAADVLAALEIAAGNPAAAARAARIGLTGDAGAEQLWRALMRAEHAAGNLTGVREAWNRCLDAISEIAPDGEPHPSTAALYQELLGGARARPAWAGG